MHHRKTMRRITLTALVLAAAAVINADWINFRSATGGFSVDLPGKPEKQTSNLPVQGTTVTGYTFTAQGHGTLALLTATVLPSTLDAANSASFRKSYLDSFIRSSKAHETARHHLTIHGFS